jgi:hypothetical protein
MSFNDNDDFISGFLLCMVAEKEGISFIGPELIRLFFDMFIVGSGKRYSYFLGASKTSGFLFKMTRHCLLY